MSAVAIPGVSVRTAGTGASQRPDELGMRAMQRRAYSRRGEQYLLIKSPPASGKSRALMFIALDKLHRQGLRQAVVVVPERSIGASFADEALTAHGFYYDWQVLPQWNLCNVPGADEPRVAKSKVAAVKAFLDSPDRTLVCTHATFRFAFEQLGPEAFDDRLVAVDEFHHVSVGPDNRLGAHLGALIARDRAHIVAMTGSYFRGDGMAVLAPADEARFETVTYTYYEQLNGYTHLKALDIGYFFYSGRYLEAITLVLDAGLKTIVHIPNVNSGESTGDKLKEVDEIMEALGTYQGLDATTGFDLVQRADGRVLRVADLVDDDPKKRDRVMAALRDPAKRGDRGHVDVIIALGMAKEGFDWIWCEHALTVGYRSSLTEIVQIIGRATRDAPGKARARFTNLIAEPDASEQAVSAAVNDTLKAIAASLLMEQVLAPRFDFLPKGSGPQPDTDYGPDGYQAGRTNVGVRATGEITVEVKGLAPPTNPEAARICRQDLSELTAAVLQDNTILVRGLFDEEVVPEELTQLRVGKIVRDRYPDQDEHNQEAIRQHVVAALAMVQEAKRSARAGEGRGGDGGDGEEGRGSTAFVDGLRRFVTDVRELDVDLIDRINPFAAAYSVLAQAMNADLLRKVQLAIGGKRTALTLEEARALATRARGFKIDKGRAPDIASPDAWERRMAEGVAALKRFRETANRG